MPRSPQRAPNALLVTAAALLAASALACGGRGGQDAAPLAIPLGDAPQRPARATWVTVVEFADFRCPFCRAEEPALERVLAAHVGEARLVFVQLPVHGAQPALATECARRQGKFWELHDALFSGPADTADQIAAAAAAIPGLDLAAWTASLASPDAAAHVEADVARAFQFGVDGTPTLVVNGQAIVGAVGEDVLERAISSAAARARASGVAEADYYDREILGSASP